MVSINCFNRLLPNCWSESESLFLVHFLSLCISWSVGVVGPVHWCTLPVYILVPVSHSNIRSKSILSMSCSLHVHPSDFFVPANMLFMDFFRDFIACQRSFWFVVPLESLTNLFTLKLQSCKCTLIEKSYSARSSYIFTVPICSCHWDTGPRALLYGHSQ